MQDKLDQIFNIQKKFTEKFFKEKTGLSLEQIKNDNDKRIYWTKDYILSLVKEATEILDEINWKNHTSKCEKDIEDNILEESIDVIKYLFGLLSIYGFTSEEIYKKFIDKSNVVEIKYNQEKIIKEIKEKCKNIVFIDIDGILAKWPDRFITLANIIKNTDFKTLKELNENIDKKDLIDLKDKYRINAFKRDLDLYNDANEFLYELKQLEYYIILLTSRPYKKYYRIFSDTIHWLNKNNLKYDAIIFEDKKEEYIINNFDRKNVKFIVDDEIENAKKLSNAKFNVYLKYNYKLYDTDDYKYLSKDKNIILINNLNEIIKCQKLQLK